MIQVTNIEIWSLTLDYLDLLWEIGPVSSAGDANSHPIFDYDFYVLRSGDSPLGPYQEIGGPFRDQYVFRDTSVKLLHKWRQYYYKIKVVHRSSGEEKEFGPKGHKQPPPDLIAAEVIRLEDILFREFVGRRCWLLPIRTFGPYCSCFDLTLGRRTRSNHLPCFGTGFLGGFMSPVECFVQIDPNTEHSQQTSLQEKQPSDTTARMISFPPVKAKDIIVESENRRWRVISSTPTQRLRSSLHFEIRLHEIPRGDVEYDIPIDVDLFSMSPSAERNFTLPTNPREDGEYSDIAAFFNYPPFGVPR